MTAMTFELEYQVPWLRTRGRCGCSVFFAGRARPGVIVVTELADNPGPSVTNSIEAIATHLENQLRLPTLAGYHLVEHYPPNLVRGSTFSLVELGHNGTRFQGPVWTHLTEEQFERLIPEKDEPAEVLKRWMPKREVANVDG